MIENLFGLANPSVDSGGSWGGPHSGGVTIVFAINGNVIGARMWCLTGQSGGIPGYYTSRLYRVDSSDVGGSGTLLASKDFGLVTANAWNTILYDTPVAVTAGLPYRVAIGSNDFVGMKTNVFTSQLVHGNLTGVANNATVNGLSITNGTMETSSKSGYPNNVHGFMGPGGIIHYTDPLFETPDVPSGGTAHGHPSRRRRLARR